MNNKENIYQTWSDEQLLKAVREEENLYNLESLELIKQEMHKRKLPIEKPTSELTDAEKNSLFKEKNKKLTHERNLFLTVFLLMVLFSIPFRLIEEGENLYDVSVALTFVAMGIFVYLVYRLSRAVENKTPKTVCFCVLSVFSLLYLIPFIGLLIDVRKKRREISNLYKV